MRLISRNTKEMADFEITDLYYKELERSIKNQPELYLWSHNRWKRTREEFNKNWEVEEWKGCETQKGTSLNRKAKPCYLLFTSCQKSRSIHL